MLQVTSTTSTTSSTSSVTSPQLLPSIITDLIELSNFLRNSQNNRLEDVPPHLRPLIYSHAYVILKTNSDAKNLRYNLNSILRDSNQPFGRIPLSSCEPLVFSLLTLNSQLRKRFVSADGLGEDNMRLLRQYRHVFYNKYTSSNTINNINEVLRTSVGMDLPEKVGSEKQSPVQSTSTNRIILKSKKLRPSSTSQSISVNMTQIQPPIIKLNPDRPTFLPSLSPLPPFYPPLYQPVINSEFNLPSSDFYSLPPLPSPLPSQPVVTIEKKFQTFTLASFLDNSPYSPLPIKIPTPPMIDTSKNLPSQKEAMGPRLTSQSSPEQSLHIKSSIHKLPPRKRRSREFCLKWSSLDKQTTSL